MARVASPGGLGPGGPGDGSLVPSALAAPNGGPKALKINEDGWFLMVSHGFSWFTMVYHGFSRWIVIYLNIYLVLFKVH